MGRSAKRKLREAKRKQQKAEQVARQIKADRAHELARDGKWGPRLRKRKH